MQKTTLCNFCFVLLKVRFESRNFVRFSSGRIQTQKFSPKFAITSYHAFAREAITDVLIRRRYVRPMSVTCRGNNWEKLQVLYWKIMINQRSLESKFWKAKATSYGQYLAIRRDQINWLFQYIDTFLYRPPVPCQQGSN